MVAKPYIGHGRRLAKDAGKVEIRIGEMVAVTRALSSGATWNLQNSPYCQIHQVRLVILKVVAAPRSGDESSVRDRTGEFC